MARGCSVEGCGRAHEARGYCEAHYKRWRKHGDARIGGALKTPRGEAMEFLRRVVMTHGGKGCLDWPYRRTPNGYPVVYICGRRVSVTRLLCEERHGAPPSARHQAAHSCGRGRFGCVAPGHLRWATPVENAHDRHAHGTDNRGETHGMSKLTVTDVRAIRALHNSLPLRAIADRFGISESTACRIVHRQAWTWLDD